MTSQVGATGSSHLGILGWIERTGNRLPDPVFIFFYLIIGLIFVSVATSFAGLAVPHPTKLADGTTDPLIVEAVSLLAPESIQRLWVDMPKTFTHFHPLGYVLVVMLGAGVAERTGLFAAAMSAAVRRAPTYLLTPAVAFVGMVSSVAADAAYVVLIPLAGVLYAVAGRHPIAGIAASFAAVSGGFSANIVPGQFDALLFGITEQSAEALAPAFEANIAGNWYFIAVMTFVFLPAIWIVTDRYIEPCLGTYAPQESASDLIKEGNQALTQDERKGLRWAGFATLAIAGLWLLMTIGPGTPLLDEAASPEAQMSPFYRSLVGGFLVLFLAAGWAYGRAVGTVKSHRDIVRMMTESMSDLSYYLVLAFAAAHFVAMFNWSNLGLIFAVQGADAIKAAGLPTPLTLTFIILLTAVVNVFVGSASAKWALLAPIIVPMLMLLDISPEMTTAAYRVGDGATNIVTPLMVYFPLILMFCHRWQKDFGLGSLTATMVPYSLALLGSGLALTIVWVLLGIPLGPNAPVEFVMPR